jgi:Terminase large subunit, T4likevirus-type, N-terminal
MIEQNQTTVVAAGRRSGKTRCAAAAALHNLLLVPELDAAVGRGERRYAVSIANSERQAKVFLDHAKTLVTASPTLAGELVSQTAAELVFRGDRVLAAFPCSARTGRGYAVSFLLLDEFGHFYDETDGEAVAGRVYAAMTPSLATFGPSSRLVIASTPFGGTNKFAELWTKADNGELPGAAAFHGTTREMNPRVPDDYLQAQEVALGTAEFAQEYEAAFAQFGLSFIEADALEDVVGSRQGLDYEQITNPVVGFDPAFSRDAAAAVVVGRDKQDGNRLLVAHAERWVPRRKSRFTRLAEKTSQIDYVLDELAAIVKCYPGARVVSDAHLPGEVEAGLAARNVGGVRFKSPDQTEVFQELRARIHTGRITLVPDEQLLSELKRLRTRYRAGSSVVETPRVGDSHCDMAKALGAAVFEFAGHAPMSAEYARKYDDLYFSRGPESRAIGGNIMKEVF